MGRFLAGLVLGGLLGALAFHLLQGSDSTEPGRALPVNRMQTAGPTEPELSSVELPSVRPGPELSGRAESTSSFAQGTTLLRIGDAYVFGEDPVRRPASDETCDLVCYDISGATVDLSCPRKSSVARMPIVPSGVELDDHDLFSLVVDAPPEMEADRAKLLLRPSRTDSGIALVRSRQGKACKVRLVRVDGHANALRRVAAIEYAAVPQAPGSGGGRVHIPGAVPTTAVPDEERDRLLGMLQQPAALEIHSWSFATRAREIVKLTQLPDELQLNSGRMVVVDEPLHTTLVSRGPTAIFLPKGVEPEGRLESNTFGSFLVEGDFEGEFRNRSFGFIHIHGDLLGTIQCSSFTLLILDGRLLGTVKADSITKLLLRGDVPDPKASIKGWGFTLYLPGTTTERDLDRWPVGKELHLESSDLPDGEHEDVAGWNKVFVGEEGWADWAAR